MTTRRQLLATTGTLGLAAFLLRSAFDSPEAANETFPVAFSDADWRKRLTPAQFAVLRKSSTERPYTSPLLQEKRQGEYACAGCELGLFSSSTKFESNTGWPSFWAPLDQAVGTTSDRSLGMTRTSVHCSRCGGHLGHVFDDGPKPTGLRYCMNGVAMTFRATAA